MNSKNINFVVTIILALAFSFFLPWWSVMLAAFITAFRLPLRGVTVFLVPFVAILLFWAVYAYILANGNGFVLSKKIAVLLPLEGNPYLLILVTAVVGGLAAGIAAIFGKQCQLLLRKKEV